MSEHGQPNQPQGVPPVPPQIAKEDAWTGGFTGVPVDRSIRLGGGPPPVPSRDGRPSLSTEPPVPSRDGRPPLSTEPPVPSRDGRPPLSDQAWRDAAPLLQTVDGHVKELATFGASDAATHAASLAEVKKKAETGDFAGALSDLNDLAPVVGAARDKAAEEARRNEQERAAFLEKLGRLGDARGKIDERVRKLTSPPAAVTAALQVATDAQATAEAAGTVKPQDWPNANTALEALQKAIDGVNTACLDEATRLAAAFDRRYADKDKDKPAGKDIVAKYTAYGTARKTLAGLVSAKDGPGAMAACPAAEAALAAFEIAASPSAEDKRRKAEAAFDTLKNLSDEDLGKKSLQEQAELALDLCANGTPSGSIQVSGGSRPKFLPAPGSTLEQLCRLYKHSAPDPKFMAKRANQREQIADEVVKMEEIKKLHKPNGDLDDAYWNNFINDSDKVLRMMQKICDTQADAMGMAHIVVSKNPDPPVDDGTMGGYDPGTNSISLNFFPGYLKPVSEALDTIIHETFHAHQDVIVKKLKAGEIGPGDDDYATALMYMVNDIPVGYVGSGSVGDVNYKTQPTEFDSFHHAGKTIESLMVKAKAAAKGTGG